MSSIKTRLHNARAKFLRRSSGTSTATRSIASSAGSVDRSGHLGGSTLRKSASLSRLPEASGSDMHDETSHDKHSQGERVQGDDMRLVRSEILGAVTDAAGPEKISRGSSTSATTAAVAAAAAPAHAHQQPQPQPQPRSQPQSQSQSQPQPQPPAPPSPPALTLEAPTPIHPDVVPPIDLVPEPSPSSLSASVSGSVSASASASASTSASAAPTDASDADQPAHPSSKPTSPRLSARSRTNAKIVQTLLAPDAPPAAMLHRKIWVKRPNASATLVQIREDDLVDDVRDMILKKYTNSLGRSFDAPDVTLRIVPRDAARTHDRTLGPEEEMCRTLDAYFPGGQTVHEALIIDVPQRRTPKPSPRAPAYHDHHDDARYAQTEYFPPMSVINPSPSALSASQHERIPPPHSMAVISTGQLPPLPSPGGTNRRLHQPHRPKYPRHNTASPTTLGGGIPSVSSARPPNRPRHDSSASEAKNSATSNNPIPTPPASTDANTRNTSNPPTPRVASPQPAKDKRRRKKAPLEPPSLPAGLLDGSVPPINVLIVEDNIINLRVLGAFMQRLKVRWQRAMNGKEAVTKWKAGGFHLVLMDIQLPVMNGLEATKEIRRLERVNSIGVFSSGSSEAPNNRLGLENGNVKGKDVLDADDRLGVDKGLFKSPVIIVALTASSLQSDRHEALAAGCNDFLTKPVNFVWLERKVKEWGCMQALIDFDGWRKWKDFAEKSETMDGKSKMSASFTSIASKKKDLTLSPTLAANPPDGSGMSVNGVGLSARKEEEKEKKSKRKSVGVVPPPALPEENENGTPGADDAST